MRIAVLASPSSWYLGDLRRAAAGRHEITAVPFTQLRGSIGFAFEHVQAGAMDLRSFDAVLVRTMPPGSLEQVVFRMDALARMERLGVPVINPARSLEAAVDKYLATVRMHDAGLLVPRTIACQTVDEGMAAFAELNADVVVKPLFGSEGRGITRLNDEALALRAFKMLSGLGAVLYLQEFIPHQGFDLRVLKVGRRYYGMRRTNPGDWRTNVSRGATAAPLELSAELMEMAERAAAAMGAPIAGVDLLPGHDGRLYAIEVNAVPGWQALSRALGVDIAQHVLEYAESVAETGPEA
jgi:ribosomal protein S6--L-glutamate ligase